MENLPIELSQRIFCLLDYQHLAAAQQVCRNWKSLASEDGLWHNLFIKRWGTDQAKFFHPLHPKTWKMTYETQDRCDRVGLGLTITREGSDYYIVYQGEIQHLLGSKKSTRAKYGQQDSEVAGGTPGISSNTIGRSNVDILPIQEGPCPGLFDKILFFVGDLECASRQAKCSRRL
eukprot:Gb_38989 [translate_table: standard]